MPIASSPLAFLFRQKRITMKFLFYLTVKVEPNSEFPKFEIRNEARESS